MAEEFETGICGGSWWNNLMMLSNHPSSRSGGGGGGFIGGGGSSFCSLGNTPAVAGADFGSWVAPDLMMSPSCKDVDVAVSNNSSVSDGSAVFQNDSDSGGSTGGGGGGVMMDSSGGLQLLGFGGLSSSSPSSTSDWNNQHQAALMNGGGSDWCNRTTTEDPLNNLNALSNHFCNINQHQPSLNDNNLATTTTATTSYGGYPSTLIQSLFDSDVPYGHQQQQPPPLFSNSLLLNDFSSSSSSSPSWPKFQNPNQHTDDHLMSSGLSNGDAMFWDSSSSASTTTTTSVSRSIEGIRGAAGFTKPLQGHAQARFAHEPLSFEQKPTSCSTTTKAKKEEGSNSKESKSGAKKASNSSSGSEPAFKKPRIETPSPLPTFKVRKEKLGDRITALQQLVSPFGKTDTASVLHEAIEYIKFLHDQVSVLSTPYMKNGNPNVHQHQQKGTNVDRKLDQEAQNQQDLRTRGLCLVPISSTFPVASETTADFWTPTFGGSFR